MHWERSLPTKVDGSIRHLQGMFGFIDWIDLSHKKALGILNGAPSSIDGVKQTVPYVS